MLLKLLKYDFRAMWKQFSLIWGAALALALVNRFTGTRQDRAGLLREDAANLIQFALAAVFVAMFVISAIFVIQRFGRGLLGNEGYLMHTLPVRSWQLVTSKLICAAVTCIGSMVVAFLTPFIMLRIDWSEMFDPYLWEELFRVFVRHPDNLALILELLLLMFSCLIALIASVYLAISIGHLFSQHRKLVSIIAFIGLYFLLANLYARVFSYRVIQSLLGMTTSSIHGSLLTASAIMLIPAVLFLAAVCWILDHKLNLE